MKSKWFGFGIVLIIFTFAQPAIAANAVTANQTNTNLVLSLTQLGVLTFAEDASLKAWPTPAICSAWALNRLPKTDSKRNEEAQKNRTFGSQMLQMLDDISPTMYTADVSVLAERCQSLLDLCQWLMHSDGHGNVLLAAKASSMASVGIARLACNLQVPLGDTKKLFSRWQSVSPNADHAARAFNIEAGQHFFAESNTTCEILGRKWEIMVFRSEVRQAIANRPQSIKLVQEQLKGVDQKKLAEIGVDDKGSVEKPLPGEEFFMDDDRPSLPTTRACWDGKHHREIVVVLVSVWDQRLGALIEFREKVGSFPLRPKGPGMFMIEGKSAFREAWKPHATDKNQVVDNHKMKIYVNAWLVYNAVNTGTFWDHDTEIIRLDEAGRNIKKPLDK